MKKIKGLKEALDKIKMDMANDLIIKEQIKKNNYVSVIKEMKEFK